MTPRTLRLFPYMLLLSSPLIGTTPALGAAVNVTEWRLRSTINLGGGNIHDGTNTVINPLAAVYSTSSQNSESSSIVSAEWHPTGHLDFYLEAEHHCQGAGSTPANAECRSTGNIFFTPQVDSFIHFATEYNHALGSGFRTAGISVSLRAFGAPKAIVLEFQRNNTLSHPPIDTLSYTSGFVPILAGVEYVVNYGLEINSTTGSPDSISHANGHFSMQITPVPEPTTLAALSVIGPFILHRRRRV